MTAPHANREQLAALAEGQLDDHAAAALREHLAECRTCLSAYVDAVRYRAAWLADPEAFRLVPGDRKLARSRFHGAPRMRRRIGMTSHWVLGFMGSAVVAAVVIWGLLPIHSWRSAIVLNPAVEAALAETSVRGLVLPGVERAAPAADRRSGSPSGSMEVEREVKAAVDAYEARRSDPGAGVRLIAALLANGEVRAAGDYATECLRRRPDSVALLVYGAEIRLRSNDLPGAEAMLDRAEHLAPRDPLVALDRGIVLLRSGRVESARKLLDRAAGASAAPIADRARRELSESR